MNKKSMKEQIKFTFYEVEEFLYRVFQKIPYIDKLTRRKKYGKRKILSNLESNNAIREGVLKNANSSNGYMVARFGTTEGRAFFEYLQIIMGHRKDFTKLSYYNMQTCSGFFSNSREMLLKWGDMMLELVGKLDILATMRFYGEKYIAKNLVKDAILIPNGAVAPTKEGWSDSLEGKKVLVISAFKDTIEKQYKNNREKIFPNSNALPKFELKCIKAVQTIADERDERFSNWFDALDYMVDEAKKIDFDVAIIGCGSYGLPLAAKIKEMGKVAIHVGGDIQQLFGIRYGRGDKNPKIKAKYTDAWVYPSENEKPKGYEKVEGGCYWE